MTCAPLEVQRDVYLLVIIIPGDPLLVLSGHVARSEQVQENLFDSHIFHTKRVTLRLFEFHLCRAN